MFGDEGHTFFVTTAVVEFARIFECGSQYFLGVSGGNS
jgi:hypothetical protein